jgi:hypothetical protein
MAMCLLLATSPAWSQGGNGNGSGNVGNHNGNNNSGSFNGNGNVGSNNGNGNAGSHNGNNNAGDGNGNDQSGSYQGNGDASAPAGPRHRGCLHATRGVAGLQDWIAALVALPTGISPSSRKGACMAIFGTSMGTGVDPQEQ